MSEEVSVSQEDTEQSESDVAEIKPEFSDAQTQKRYEQVKEVLLLLNQMVEKEEIAYYEVPEVLTLALSSSIHNMVEVKNHEVLDKESSQLMNYLWKQYNHKLRRKNYMFTTQIIAPAKFTTYVVMRAVETIKNILSSKDKQNEKGTT